MSQLARFANGAALFGIIIIIIIIIIIAGDKRSKQS